MATIYIDGATSQDWEDIACGPGPGGQGHYVYIADTGGNAGGDANTVYRVREPDSIHDQTVHYDSRLKFRYVFDDNNGMAISSASLNSNL